MASRLAEYLPFIEGMEGRGLELGEWADYRFAGWEAELLEWGFQTNTDKNNPAEERSGLWKTCPRKQESERITSSPETSTEPLKKSHFPISYVYFPQSISQEIRKNVKFGGFSLPHTRPNGTALLLNQFWNARGVATYWPHFLSMVNGTEANKLFLETSRTNSPSILGDGSVRSSEHGVMKWQYDQALEREKLVERLKEEERQKGADRKIGSAAVAPISSAPQESHVVHFKSAEWYKRFTDQFMVLEKTEVLEGNEVRSNNMLMPKFSLKGSLESKEIRDKAGRL